MTFHDLLNEDLQNLIYRHTAQQLFSGLFVHFLVHVFTLTKFKRISLKMLHHLYQFLTLYILLILYKYS